MRMNVSQTLAPDFWRGSFVPALRNTHGYVVGLFGKVLNDMQDYGCSSGTTPGVDRMFVQCEHVFYNDSVTNSCRFTVAAKLCTTYAVRRQCSVHAPCTAQ
jgi:hypothetical protein